MMTAESLEHPVEGLRNAHQKKDKEETVQGSILLLRKVPMKEKDEKADEGKPLEEFHLRSKGHEGKGKMR